MLFLAFNLISRIIKENNFKGTYAYLENITVSEKLKKNTTKTCKEMWTNIILILTKVNVFFLLFALICWDTELQTEHANQIQNLLNQY